MVLANVAHGHPDQFIGIFWPLPLDDQGKRQLGVFENGQGTPTIDGNTELEHWEADRDRDARGLAT